MALQVAIVADDLTGALDAAAPFAARGLHTRVAVDAEDLGVAISHAPQVVAVNTDTRHADPDAATTRVARSTEQLAALRPAFLFKKIDSTLRGPVSAEIAAVRGVVGGRALVCPAVPDQGRTVRGGRVHVDGQPLGETESGRDGRAGAVGDDLATLLSGLPGRTRAVGPRACWPDDHHLAVDAESGTDLAAVAERMLAAAEPWLAVGAAGLAEALALAAFGPRLDRSLVPPSAPALFVIGSRTARTRAQIAALRARGVTTVVDTRATQPADGGPVLVVPDTSQDTNADPAAVAADLSARAHQVLRQMQPGLLTAAGGETAHALLRELDVRSVQVVDEVWPGIVCARICVAGRTVILVTKAGGFGAETLFADLAAWCRKA